MGTERVFHQNRYAAELDKAVVNGCAWLDIGAGHLIHNAYDGVTCEALADRAAFLAGCDLGTDVLDHPHLDEARIADAADLPWDDGRFDLVTANMVAEHLSDPAAVLAEVYRVLVPGGSFLFVTPSAHHPVVAASMLVPRRLRRYYRVLFSPAGSEEVFSTFYRLNTESAVRRVAESVGFRVAMCSVLVSRPPVLPGLLGSLEAASLSVARRVGFHSVGSNLVVRLQRPHT